jgi:hypothetical protein
MRLALLLQLLTFLKKLDKLVASNGLRQLLEDQP